MYLYCCLLTGNIENYAFPPFAHPLEKAYYFNFLERVTQRAFLEIIIISVLFML